MKKADSKWPVYSIERKKGTVYFAKMSTGNNPYTKTFERKMDAINWLKEQHANQEINSQSLKVKYRNKTVEWLCDYWIENYAIPNKQESSVIRDRGYFKNQILPEFSKIKISDVSAHRTELWMAKLREKLSVKSCNDALGLLKKVFTDACRWRFIAYNPLLSVKAFKSSDKEFKFWSFEEKSRFINYVYQNNPELFPLFLATLVTGMRAGELRGLKWDCIDFHTNQITIKRILCQKTRKLKDTTKSGKIRRVPMNNQLRTEIVNLKNGLKTEFVFENIFDFSHPSRNLKRICKASDVPEIRFHDLRHTFASHFMMAGGNVYDLQKLLGHASVQMTERYSHLSPDHLNGVTEILTIDVSRSDNVIKFKR